MKLFSFQDVKTIAPTIIPITSPAIDITVAAIPSLLPAFHEIAPKTIPRVPNRGGMKRNAIIPQTRPAIAKPCLLSDFGDEFDCSISAPF